MAVKDAAEDLDDGESLGGCHANGCGLPTTVLTEAPNTN
jgi:hypothetical protein